MLADLFRSMPRSEKAVRALCPGSLFLDRRTLLLAAMASGVTGAAMADSRSVVISGLGEVLVHVADNPRAVLAFLPGFGCEARRYDWLAPLAATGVTVVIPELASIDGLAGMQRLFDHLRTLGVPYYLAGHSAGGALVLDALEADPQRNVRLVRPTGYAPPSDVAGVAVMGCSLQPQMLDFTLPHRQDGTPLTRPNNIPLLFISGTHDAIAKPDLVGRTAARYAGPVTHVTLQGADHYGFASGTYPSDNPAADLDGAGEGKVQRDATLGLLRDSIAA